jgi:enamine deaminase RidA (YjgF/YER057c/UK114 family)
MLDVVEVECLADRFHLAVRRAGCIVATAKVGPGSLPQSTYLEAWNIAGLVLDRESKDRDLEVHALAAVMRWIRSAGGRFLWADVPEDAAGLTCRADGIADLSVPDAPRDAELSHVRPLPRLSRAVIHRGVVHLSGLLPNRADVPVRDQTREVLEKMDAVMALAGTDRSRLISATVYLANLSGVAEMNLAWEAWLAPHLAPARSCVQAIPGSAEYAVEITAVAAA